MRRFVCVGVLVMAAVSGLNAQWVTIKLPNTPRTADGKPNLKAPPPRLPDRKVDFSGIWYPDVARTDPTASTIGQTLGEDPAIRLTPTDGTPLPLLPAAEAEASERRRRGDIYGSAKCEPHSVVSGLLVPTPFKVIHTAGVTLVLFEEMMHFQQVFTDGRSFPTEFEPSWLGSSIGRWERDEFVIETRGMNGRASLGTTGSLKTSESLHVIERFRRPDYGSLELRVTFDDPTMFSRTWTSKPVWFKLLPDTDFIENMCDNERDVERIRVANPEAR